MTELQLPWLEMALVLPLLGALLAAFSRSADKTRLIAIVSSGLSLLFSLGAWQDFSSMSVFEAHDHWDIITSWLGPDALVIDELNAPLLPLVSLMFFLTSLSTLKTKVKRFPFALNLVLEFLVLATLACRQPWGIILLIALQCIPVYLELVQRGKSTRIFVIHMGLSTVMLVAGWAMIDAEGVRESHSAFAIGLITVAVLIRSGCVPVHCWLTDLFEKATLGTAMLYVTPMIGAYAAVRMVLPVAPDWALRVIALVSLFTSVYSAGMALVQTETRRFFCYLLLSNMSLVLVGLEIVSAIGLTGALCAWLSVGLTLTGFGLTLRAIESRQGRLSLRDFHGLYNSMPLLGTFFLITGLASVGFPGTVGFVGIELLVEGATNVYPAVGIFVVIATALNGIAVMHTYFRLFTGTEHTSTFSLGARLPERISVLILTVLIIGGGLIPQPGVASRYHAAKEIMLRRRGVQADHDGVPVHASLPETNDKASLNSIEKRKENE